MLSSDAYRAVSTCCDRWLVCMHCVFAWPQIIFQTAQPVQRRCRARYVFRVRVYQGHTVVHVLCYRLRIFLCLTPNVDGASYMLCPDRMTPLRMPLVNPSSISDIEPNCVFNLKRIWRHIQLMRAEPTMRVALAGEVVGKRSCGELGRRSIGLGSTALIA